MIREVDQLVSSSKKFNITCVLDFVVLLYLMVDVFKRDGRAVVLSKLLSLTNFIKK